MSLTYNTWLATAANLAGTNVAQPNFVIEAPAAIDYAELRIYRDIDLINTITRDASQVCVPGQRNINIPTAFVTVTAANVITPAGTTPDNGARGQLTKLSSEYLDATWPSVVGTGPPTRFAILSQSTMLLGPWPDQGYVMEIIGTQRGAPLSVSNQTTFISLNLPDLFLCATMIHIAGYQKNFGAQSDDPRSAVSWEMEYEKLLAGADAEELRKRYQGTTAAPPQGMSKASEPPAKE